MNPATLAEKIMLRLIAYRESGGNYTSPPRDPVHATASGAYQFIKATWAFAASNTGLGSQYVYAYQAPPQYQDSNALWLLRTYGPNSSRSWQSSGPYPSMASMNYAAQGLT